jgi:hypothetical protein
LEIEEIEGIEAFTLSGYYFCLHPLPLATTMTPANCEIFHILIDINMI